MARLLDVCRIGKLALSEPIMIYYSDDAKLQVSLTEKEAIN